MMHDGDDLGLPHLSPEQKMVMPSSSTPHQHTEQEERVIAFMSRLATAEPKMYLIANLHFIEKDWWISEVRRKLRKAGGTQGVQTKDWTDHVEMKHEISRSTYYRQLDTLRARLFEQAR